MRICIIFGAVLFSVLVSNVAFAKPACENAYHSIMNDLEMTGEPVTKADENFAWACEAAMRGKGTDPGAKSPSGVHPKTVAQMKTDAKVSASDSQRNVGGVCKGWTAKACFDQGLDFYDMAKSGTKTLPTGEPTAVEANKRFLRLCEKEYLDACPYAVTVSRDMLSRPDQERLAYNMACGHGQAQYCGAGYMLSSNPDKGAYSLTFAKRFAEKGCALGDDLMCRKQAELNSGAKPARKAASAQAPQTPLDQAREAEQACLDGDIEWGCTTAGLWYGDYHGGYPQVKNVAKAQKYSNLSCAAGFSEGCVSAMHINNPDNGYPANPIGLETAYRQICLNASENYCDWGVYGFSEGAYGLSKDFRKAVEFATISCDRFDENCYFASYYMYKTNKYQFPVQKYAKKSCDLGEASGCNIMAKSLFDSGDNQQAYAYQDAACALGQQSTCEVVARNRATNAQNEARRARLDAEYERCRGGCISSTAASPVRSSSPSAGWGGSSVRWGSASGPSHEAKERYKYNSCMSNQANWGRC